jgi:Ubiquitin family
MGEVFQDEKRAALSTDAPSDSVDIHVKWRGSTYSFSLQLSTNLSELKLLIQGLTNVSPESQKLIGLSKKAGTKLNANATLESHQPVLKNGAVNITLIGTPDAEIAELKEKGHGVSSVFNDFSHEFSPATKEWQQLQEFSQKTSIHFINEPRPGKKLLVLDLDHTLLDFSSKEDISPLEMKVYLLLHCFCFLFLRVLIFRRRKIQCVCCLSSQWLLSLQHLYCVN